MFAVRPYPTLMDMTSSNFEVSIQRNYVLVERAKDYVVILDEQPRMLTQLSAICKEANCRNVLILGTKTKVRLSTLDILELASQIANTRLKIAVVEVHDAPDENVSFLEDAVWNRGGLIRFYSSGKTAKNWLGIS